MDHENDWVCPSSPDPEVSTAGGVAVEPGHLGDLYLIVPFQVGGDPVFRGILGISRWAVGVHSDS